VSSLNFKNFGVIKDSLKGFFSVGEMTNLEEAEIMLWCHDINRNYRHDGLKFAPITDSLNDRFNGMGLSTLTIARPYSGISENQCYGKVCRVNGIIARAIAIDQCIRILKKIIKVPPHWLTINFQVIAWERILRKIDPKILIGIEPVKELCLAAKNNNIPTMDVQHGVQMDVTGEHSGHFYRTAYRGKGQKGWPDFVACWDQESTDRLIKHRSQYTKPLTLGHPWALRFLSNKDAGDPLVNHAFSQYELASDLPVILYSLQYSRDVNGNTDSFVRIPDELDRFIKNEGHAFTWWLRIHPQLLRDEFREDTFNKLEELYSSYNNVNWVEVSYAPLPYVLSKASLHLTRDSSVVKEAAWFGIKSGLFDEPNMRQRLNSLYQDLLDAGDAEIITGYEHVKEFIFKTCVKSDPHSNDEILEIYEDCLQNILKILKKSSQRVVD